MKKLKNKKFRITFNAPVTLTFVLICLAALCFDTLTGGWANKTFFSVYGSSPLSPLTYVRIVGHVFGHASWEHLIGNMMMLLITAPLLEEKYGSVNILFVILTTAVATGILSALIFPNVMLLGASGVVFAFILLSSITSVRSGELPLTFILVALLYLGQQVYEGIFLNDNVSNFGHIIGGTCGTALGYFLNRGGRVQPKESSDSGSGETYTYY